jgi:hypothetical protein
MAQHHIDAVDRRVDLLVYELYGLTDEEVEIVEAEARGPDKAAQAVEESESELASV